MHLTTMLCCFSSKNRKYRPVICSETFNGSLVSPELYGIQGFSHCGPKILSSLSPPPQSGRILHCSHTGFSPFYFLTTSLPTPLPTGTPSILQSSAQMPLLPGRRSGFPGRNRLLPLNPQNTIPTSAHCCSSPPHTLRAQHPAWNAEVLQTSWLNW